MNEAGRVILATIFGVVVVEFVVYLLGQYLMDYFTHHDDTPTTTNRRGK